MEVLSKNKQLLCYSLSIFRELASCSVFIAAVLLFITAGIPNPRAIVNQADQLNAHSKMNKKEALAACAESISEKEGTFYVNFSSESGVRLKSGEVALRQLGAFEVPEAIFQKLEDGQSAHLAIYRTRSIVTVASAAVEIPLLEIFAVRQNGTIDWAAAFLDRTVAGEEVRLLLTSSNHGSNWSCAATSASSELSFSSVGLEKSVANFVQHRGVHIPSDVYSKLGL